MRALVAYASKRGSTAKIARAVAGELVEAGIEADSGPAGAMTDLAPYDAVVLGSAVYMGRWRPEARRFLRRHAKALAGKPFWIFSSGPVGDPAKDGGAKWLEPPKVVARAERLGVRGHVVFGGCVPDEPHGFVERSMVRDTPPEFRDRRDWDQIRAWAQAIGAELSEEIEHQAA
jgi:menaquinone-dependent protoporphyrinogen oxidase